MYVKSISEKDHKSISDSAKEKVFTCVQEMKMKIVLLPQKLITTPTGPAALLAFFFTMLQCIGFLSVTSNAVGNVTVKTGFFITKL